MSSKITVNNPQGFLLLNGDEAVARGAVEADIKVAAAYPGTPSTEILETLAQTAKTMGFYAEWSVNEIVSTEVAAGAAMTGARALVSMKHVGLNVASDAIMTLAYTGIEGGLVIVVCDDPALHSSQNEQDTRYFAVHSKLPLLDAGNPQEALNMTRKAFNISEQLRIPVILRLTTRVAHGKAKVQIGNFQKLDRNIAFDKNGSRWVMVPANAMRQHRILEERLTVAKKTAETSEFNKIEDNHSDIGIIGSGVGYYYARSVLDTSKFSWLKLGFVYPFPSELVKDFASKVKQLIVIEELRPFIEENLQRLKLDVTGKNKLELGEIGEYTPDRVREALSKLGLTEKNPNTTTHTTTATVTADIIDLPPRPPNMCPGCTHRAFYYALNSVNQHIVCDSTKCIGCGICEQKCSYEKEKVIDPSKARIHVINKTATTCQACINASCVSACPNDALSKSAKTGLILINETKCKACCSCIKACQHNAITLDGTKQKVLICDTCQGNPACVKHCPKHALTLVGRSNDKIVTGDIGCYSLGVSPPLNSMQTCLCMGAGISQAAGMIHAGVKDKVFAVLGDSTFFHAGIPGLINIAYNKANVCVIILDNHIVAMTGHQPTPASGRTAMGDKTKTVNIEEITKSVGINKIITVDPYNIKATTNTLRETMTYNDPCVIISKRPCPLLLTEHDSPREITNKCGNCGLCTTNFGCPAITQTNNNNSNKTEIDPALCNGCGVCEMICPHEAIRRKPQ
ncbi:MAG: thiamine pyrophosphate-dependent enzyme [Candidatus Bathyarchaeota archaeon]|uniref:thiamine pyrophosphate-dependent enzyme n=1 Tax=Candidatus Bathycorpusculum sp. TaxID=2994959 RepID=UPI0028231D6C|nr:thiamine pyrophosphate-dependent enzyme [Candidatus Termiticorpusculum sp.]MCL2257347.1 thiamine pyrophosphate-dependent enzyme [Candidatus Termiticorpusculum sp.]MCL2292267.1 thiamine pyrophosphate-dependent enzyme [Candidatus Termiticorpusculum sp.]